MARDSIHSVRRNTSSRRANRGRSANESPKTAWHDKNSKDTNSHPPVSKGKACCFYMKKKGFKYISIIVAAHVWALIGGAIIMKIEEDKAAQVLEEERVYLHNASFALTKNITSYFRSEYQCTTSNATKTENMIYNMVHQPVETNPYLWNFAGSVFYCITLITTIGYGNQVAATTGGQVFTIIYSLIGVPLFLAALNSVASLLAPIIKYCWVRMRPCCCFICNKMGRKKIQREDTDGVLTTEDLEKMEEFDVPIYVALFLFMVWSLLWAFLFTLVFKGWSFFTSFYFLFITNFTIGLGDIVPPNAYKGLMVFPIILVSLALISMTIGVLTNCVEDKLEDLIFEDILEWDTDTSDEDTKDKAKGKAPKTQAKAGVTLGVFQQKARREKTIDLEEYDNYDHIPEPRSQKKLSAPSDFPKKSSYLRMKSKANQSGGTYVKKLKREWDMSLTRPSVTSDRKSRYRIRIESLIGVESDYDEAEDGGVWKKMKKTFGLSGTGSQNKRSSSA